MTSIHSYEELSELMESTVAGLRGEPPSTPAAKMASFEEIAYQVMDSWECYTDDAEILLQWLDDFLYAKGKALGLVPHSVSRQE